MTSAGSREDVSFVNLKTFQGLRQFDGDPAHFWRLFLKAYADVAKASAGLILSRVSGSGGGQPIAMYPSKQMSPFHVILKEKAEQLIPKAEADGVSIYQGPNFEALCVALQAGGATRKNVALLYLESGRSREMDALIEILSANNDLPLNYLIHRSAKSAIIRQEQFSAVLDLLVLLNGQDRYLSTAMSFCNELAARQGCERVSLGWIKKGYIKLQAMSQRDNFEKKMEAVEQLELAMEEAVDQDCEVVFPAVEDAATITRDHQAYASAQDKKYMCTLPMRLGNQIIGACTLERNDKPFAPEEISFLRLICDQVARRLSDLRQSDRWFGPKLLSGCRAGLGKLIGYEHTWPKVIGIVIMAALAFLAFIPVPFRIDAPVILRTDNVAFLTAPFNGHIQSVNARVGDEVNLGTQLLSFDKNELLLEEAGVEAEIIRHRRESEKARASDALADMRIADAMADQAQARLETIRFKLAQSTLKAPFKGVVVEGDQKEREGSPVNQGDVMFKIARIDSIYAEIEVSESDIHHINSKLEGEISLVSKPQEEYPIQVFRLEPAAVVQQEGNVFLVHGKVQQQIPGWWRPGMTGVAKINSGDRTLLWIASRKTIDFLRMKLWW